MFNNRKKKRNKKIKQTRDAFRLFTTLDINCLSELKYMKKVKRTDFFFIFLLKELQTAHIFFSSFGSLTDSDGGLRS